MAYTHFAFLLPGETLTLEQIKSKIETYFSGLTNSSKPIITIGDNQLTTAFEKYKFYIEIVTGQDVTTEARKIADEFDSNWAFEPYDKAELTRATQRLEFSGDRHAEFINDGFFVLEAIEKTEKVMIFSVN